MRNIKLTIAYDGAGYNGWQVQKNGRTIQAEIEKAIKKVFKKKHRIHGAGRTDAGVHAYGQVAHFKTALVFPVNKIPAALNKVLPGDIVIKSAKEVSPDFHSRFDAKIKHYRYVIRNSDQRDPFKDKYAWRVSYRLDVALMKKEAAVLSGRHDFKSFQATDKFERSSTRNIEDISIKKKGAFITVDIKADGFLYNMVRNIVGTLIEIARGYFSSGSMQNILDKKNRTAAGPTAPPQGLSLTKVTY